MGGPTQDLPQSSNAATLLRLFEVNDEPLGSRVSKRRVDRAVELAAEDALAEGAAQLDGVSPQFVQKRLRTLLERGDPRAVAISKLWAHLYSDETAPDPRPAADTGPEGNEQPPDPGPVISLPDRIELRTPNSLLHPLNGRSEPFRVDLTGVELIQAWALVGLATLARGERFPRVEIVRSSRSQGGRFAHALGTWEVVDGEPVSVPGEKGRTYKLHRIKSLAEVESASSRISRLMLPDDAHDELRPTIYYVLVELLRNAIQHSEDPLGCVTAAQLMDDRKRYEHPVVQVAVGDAGIGIPSALRRQRGVPADAEQALVYSLEPHVSGTFESGATGSKYNAGMGLFMVSEMAKLTGGRLVIATRDAALSLEGDREGLGKNVQRFIQPKGVGFPGTLVAFELPLDGVGDHGAMVETIRKKAAERTPGRVHTGWIRFSPAPDDALRLLVSRIAENTVEGETFARTKIRPRLVAGDPIVLDFRGIDTITQSFLHALLYEPLRLAWALKVPIYADNATAPVQSGLRLVETYALAG